MSRILVVGEDDLCRALGERLVAALLPGWTYSAPSISSGGITKLVAALPRYRAYAMHRDPVLCIADTDGRCAASLVDQWAPASSRAPLLLRLAVIEAESWVLADGERIAEFLGVSPSRIPDNPDSERNPKRLILDLARRSRKRAIRQEVVSALDTNRPGPGYNHHLAGFVNRHWHAREAADRSPSLARAVNRLVAVGGGRE